MSRVGKTPIKVGSGVQVKFQAPMLEVSGKVGKLTRKIPSVIELQIEKEEIRVVRNAEDFQSKSLHGLTRSLINNMVVGVAEGFSKTLELKGVGYRAQVKGNVVLFNLGFSHPVEFTLPDGMKAEVEANVKLTITAADKELVGEVAARIRKLRPPEPYKGKGIRYEGEHITLKQGKTAGK